MYDINKLEWLDFKSLLQAISTIFYYWTSTDVTKCLQYTSLVYTEHSLYNIKCNNNFKSNFLPDVNLFSVSTYATMYSRVILDFTLETMNL